MDNRVGEGQRQLPPTVPPLLSQKLPPPTHVKPPSPFHPSSTGIRPVFSSAPSIVPPTSSLSSPAPPSVFTTSSFPFFPPVSMARTPSNHNHLTTSSGFSASFLAPSPPIVAATPSQQKHTSLGAPMAFGDQPFALTRPPFSTASFAPISSTKPATSSTESIPVTSRPNSRTSSFNNDSNRPGSLPFPGHSSSTRSPSLPPPLAPATFSTPG